MRHNGKNSHESWLSCVVQFTWRFWFCNLVEMRHVSAWSLKRERPWPETIFSCDNRNCVLSLRKDVTFTGNLETVMVCKRMNNFRILHYLNLAERIKCDIWSANSFSLQIFPFWHRRGHRRLSQDLTLMF